MQNTKSKSITSKIYICNDKTFFNFYITKQAANWNLLFPEMELRGFLLALLTCNFNYITAVYAIIGFDCGSYQSNITLILLEVGECDLPRSLLHVEKTYIKLLQSTGFSNTKVIQCKIEIRRAISHCGMHSHSSIVANGHSEYIHDVT